MNHNKEIINVVVIAPYQQQGKPSVLSKLVFTAERACPEAAAAAKLRSRFPNWTEETVNTLQQA